MRRMWILAALLVAALVTSGCGDDDGAGASGGGSKPRLVVSAAASLKAAFTEYGKAFSEGDAQFSFAGSDVLATQIRKGLRPDVYAAANTKLPDALYVEGLVGKPLRFASNELVLATRAGDRKIKSLRDIARKGVRLAIGAPTVPVGAYTRTVLDRLPRAESAAILANVRTEEPDVTGIVGKLVQGAVDVGFVYHTDVTATNGKLEQVKLPRTVVPVVEYSVAIVNGSREPLAAKAFIYGLLSGKGREALDRATFGTPPPV